MDILAAIVPVVAVAALGYAARRWQVFSELEAAAVERLSFWYLLPALLFLGTATADFHGAIDWHYLGVFYGTLLAVYLGGMALGWLLYRPDWRALSVFGMGGAYSNVTVLGIPLTLQFLGQDAFVPMILIITFHNLLIFGFGTLVAGLDDVGESGILAGLGRVLREMLVNPVSGSLLAGLAWNLAGLPLPDPVRQTLDLVARAAVPGALFALGAGLTRYHMRGNPGPALWLATIKLGVMPLAMAVAMGFADVDPLWRQTAVLLSAMPVGISVYVFSRRYAAMEAAVATAIVLTSLGAALTVGGWAWWLTRG